MEDKPTKKKRILGLLEKEADPQDIAKQVGTSVDYVYKIKCTMGRHLGNASVRKGLAVANDQLPVSDHESISAIQTEERLRKSATRLDTEATKLLYSELLNGKEPTRIIAETGLFPDAVEVEAKRFKRLTPDSRHELLELLIQNCISIETEGVLRLKEKFNKTGDLRNEDIVFLMQTAQWLYGEHVKIWFYPRAVSNEYLPPEGFHRPLCLRCRMSVPGILIANGSPSDKFEKRMIFFCPEHAEYFGKNMDEVLKNSEIVQHKPETKAPPIIPTAPPEEKSTAPPFT